MALDSQCQCQKHVRSTSIHKTALLVACVRLIKTMRRVFVAITVTVKCLTLDRDSPGSSAVVVSYLGQLCNHFIPEKVKGGEGKCATCCTDSLILEKKGNSEIINHL